MKVASWLLRSAVTPPPLSPLLPRRQSFPQLPFDLIFVLLRLSYPSYSRSEALPALRVQRSFLLRGVIDVLVKAVESPVPSFFARFYSQEVFTLFHYICLKFSSQLEAPNYSKYHRYLSEHPCREKSQVEQTVISDFPQRFCSYRASYLRNKKDGRQKRGV